jgi:hypothetical protein
MALVSALGSATTNSIADIQRQFNHMHVTGIQLKPFHKQLVKMSAPEFMREVFEIRSIGCASSRHAYSEG